jgi:phenylalanine-4-hydroxylase
VAGLNRRWYFCSFFSFVTFFTFRHHIEFDLARSESSFRPLGSGFMSKFIAISFATLSNTTFRNKFEVSRIIRSIHCVNEMPFSMSTPIGVNRNSTPR